MRILKLSSPKKCLNNASDCTLIWRERYEEFSFSTLYSELLLDHYLQSSEFVSESKHFELKNELHQPKYSSESTKCTCMCLYYTCNGTFLREEQLESLPVFL